MTDPEHNQQEQDGQADDEEPIIDAPQVEIAVEPEDQELKMDPDLDKLNLPPAAEAEVQRVWTTLVRANESKRFNIDANDAVDMFFDGYLSGEIDDPSDMDAFIGQLAGDRRPDRAFTNLTATETSLIRTLKTALPDQ